MEKPPTMSSAVPNKRKHKLKNKLTASKPKKMKLDAQEKPSDSETHNDTQKISELAHVTYKEPTLEEIGERYPVLNNKELVKKFLSVSMTNNQKGRIRQVLKDNLKGTSELLLPDVIHNRIQTILKSAVNLTDTDLRKLRILYNMLKTATQSEKTDKIKNKKDSEKKTKKSKKEKDSDKDKKEDKEIIKDVKKNVKVRGPKRYVVFVGNLPLDIDKEKIMQHFSELHNYIKDVRIPKRAEGKKSSMAYVELKDEPSYELALSKHHSMLGTKRINVLYTTQKNGKVTTTEAKGKAAKLIALQKSGKLLGSIPLNRKRSQRRKKMKLALAKQAAESS